MAERRGIWKGSISFGLINIPVSLQTAFEDKDIHFSMLDSHDHAPIGYIHVNKNSGKEVPWKQIVKGYKYEKNKFVVMDEEDFKRANVRATQTVDIEDFVELNDLDPMLFDKPYYLVPQKGAEKSYELLRATLEKTEKVAIARFVLRTKQHLVAILPRSHYLILEILRFAHEVLDADKAELLEKKRSIKIAPREIQMAEQLVEGMTAKWNPEKYKDTYYTDLMKIIKYKIKHGETESYAEGEDTEEKESKSKVVDLMPLLKKSLEQRRAGNGSSHPRAKATTTKKKTSLRAHSSKEA